MLHPMWVQNWGGEYHKPHNLKTHHKKYMIGKVRPDLFSKLPVFLTNFQFPLKCIPLFNFSTLVVLLVLFG